MSHFSLIYLFVFVVNASIFLYLLFTKNKSRQIRAYMVVLSAYLATLFCFMVLLSARDIDTMKFWLNISHYTGPVGFAALLYLIIAFFYNDKNPPLWISMSILLSIVPLLIRNVCGYMDTVRFIPNPAGNVAVYEKSFFFYYFYGHTLLVIIISIVYLIIKYRTTKSRRHRQLSLFLIVSSGLCWLFGIPGNFLIPYMCEQNGVLVPETGYLFSSIVLISYFYALLKYNFMKINISYTADTIIRKISDSILITDTGGTIVRANEAACLLFASFRDGLENTHISELFPGWSNPDSRADADVSMPDEYSEFRKLPHPKNRGRILDVFFESIHDGFGDFIGLLVICRANTRLEEARHVFALTRREIEIITFLHEGLEYRQIAERLHLSMNTVRNHIQNIYAKTGARNRAILLKTVF